MDLCDFLQLLLLEFNFSFYFFRETLFTRLWWGWGDVSHKVVYSLERKRLRHLKIYVRIDCYYKRE